jgi:3-methyladenine DNA glycosylase Mpg
VQHPTYFLGDLRTEMPFMFNAETPFGHVYMYVIFKHSAVNILCLISGQNFKLKCLEIWNATGQASVYARARKSSESQWNTFKMSICVFEEHVVSA